MAKGAEEKKEGQSPRGGAGEHKSQDNSPKGKGPTQVAGGCLSWGCKKEGSRFNFCEEHYDHFKFGLIKKTGEPVSDYDKKFGHYVAHKAKRGSQKVA